MSICPRSFLHVSIATGCRHEQRNPCCTYRIDMVVSRKMHMSMPIPSTHHGQQPGSPPAVNNALDHCVCTTEWFARCAGVSVTDQGIFGERGQNKLARRSRVLHRRNASTLPVLLECLHSSHPFMYQCFTSSETIRANSLWPESASGEKQHWRGSARGCQGHLCA